MIKFSSSHLYKLGFSFFNDCKKKKISILWLSMAITCITKHVWMTWIIIRIKGDFKKDDEYVPKQRYGNLEENKIRVEGITAIKMCSRKEKTDKTQREYFFNSLVLPAFFYAVKCGLLWRRKEQKLVTSQIHGGNKIAWVHPNCGNSIGEWSEGRDHKFSKVEIPLGWTHHKFHRQQLDPCSGEVSERLEMITWKTGNNNGQLKLLSDLGQHGVKGRDRQRNGCALCQANWNASDGLFSNGIKGIS